MRRWQFMAQKNNNVISLQFDEAFYRKMAEQKYRQQDLTKALEYYEKVLELSPDDFEITMRYTECLARLGMHRRAETTYFEHIIEDKYVAESYYQLSQLNVELNEANKAFLFGMNYVLITEDDDYRDELEEMFEVNHDAQVDIDLECRLFVAQVVFQYLFSQGRLTEARDYLARQELAVLEHRVVRNLRAMCSLYLGENEEARVMLESILQEDQSDVHALCHYTLLMYNMKETEKYHRYLSILNKVVPMNDDESFKLGIVLSYLKQYQASRNVLFPLFKKGKFLSFQMFHAMSFNEYYLGNIEDSKEYWSRLEEVAHADIGAPPWVIHASAETFRSRIKPLLMSEDNHERLFGIFLLNKLNGKEVLLTEEIWTVLEDMNDYEKLYLTYLIQDLTLTRLDFIHKGLTSLYDIERFRNDTKLFTTWIDRAELLIADDISYENVKDYVAAFAYVFYKVETPDDALMKKQVMDWFNVSAYRLNRAIQEILEL